MHQFYEGSFRVGEIKSDDVVHKNLRCDRNNVKSNLVKPQEYTELGMSVCSICLFILHLNHLFDESLRRRYTDDSLEIRQINLIKLSFTQAYPKRHASIPVG